MRVAGRLGVIALLASLLVASSAFADLTTKIQVFTKTNNGNGSNLPGNGNGGVYDVVVTQGSLPSYNSPFRTFCVEYSENLSNKGRYWVDLNDSANYGGAGGPSPDPLDIKSAALYEQYLNLSPSQQSSNSTVDKYQLALWLNEEEVYYGRSLSGGGSNRWRRSDTGQTINSAYLGFSLSAIQGLINDVSNVPLIGNVGVLSLWSRPDLFTPSTARQDLLYWWPATNPVPAPGAVVLAIMGFASINGLRRRLAT